MTYDPAKHHRRSIRLPAYDYAQAGAYFVTLVAHARECLFGQVVGGQTRLSMPGEVVAAQWLRSARIRGEIELDAFVVMPNHVHGIVVIRDVGAHSRAPLPSPPHRPPRSLGSFVAGFKSAATKRINAIRSTLGLPVWQRNYYEHVIRDEDDLDRVRRYIAENALRWEEDPENPAAARPVGDHRGPPLRPNGGRL
jgi:REP element-mobilizing transposase RayT